MTAPIVTPETTVAELQQIFRRKSIISLKIEMAHGTANGKPHISASVRVKALPSRLGAPDWASEVECSSAASDPHSLICALVRSLGALPDDEVELGMAGER